MIDRRMTDLSRRSFTLGMTTLAVAAPAIVRAQDLTKVKITQPSESLSYMPIYVGPPVTTSKRLASTSSSSSRAATALTCRP